MDSVEIFPSERMVVLLCLNLSTCFQFLMSPGMPKQKTPHLLKRFCWCCWKVLSSHTFQQFWAQTCSYISSAFQAIPSAPDSCIQSHPAFGLKYMFGLRGEKTFGFGHIWWERIPSQGGGCIACAVCVAACSWSASEGTICIEWRRLDLTWDKNMAGHYQWPWSQRWIDRLFSLGLW